MDWTESSFEERLFALRDLEYRAFHCKLMPTVDPERVVGVRIPALRKLAREFERTGKIGAFLEHLPHRYYEEDNLHGMLISGWKDYDRTVEALERFLPYVDNWATCDLISPRSFRDRPPGLPDQARRWMGADHPYAVRFGVGVLMQFYLDESFDPAYLSWAAALNRDEYYIRMMIAWYFATALAKQYDAAIPYLEERRLDRWTHNRTIQKAVESRRVADKQKAYLRTLRQKGES